MGQNAPPRADKTVQTSQKITTTRRPARPPKRADRRLICSINFYNTTLVPELSCSSQIPHPPHQTNPAPQNKSTSDKSRTRLIPNPNHISQIPQSHIRQIPHPVHHGHVQDTSSSTSCHGDVSSSTSAIEKRQISWGIKFIPTLPLCACSAGQVPARDTSRLGATPAKYPR